jgi:hypothetical protein
MSEPTNILPNGPGNGGKEKLSEEQLMQYLDGKLPADAQHEVEQWLADEGMESDALEGLRTIKPEDTRHAVNKLNHSLRKTLLHKKHRRRPLKADYLTWIALAIILMLAVVAYIVIRKSI